MRRVPIAIAAALFVAALVSLTFGFFGSSPASSNPPVMDTDGDGCADLEELGSDPGVGGGRRPSYPWDFYDVNGDTTVDLFSDVFGVAFDFGAAGTAATDRSAPAPGMDIWDMGPPDGVVNLFDDIFGVAFQFGHTCDGKAEFPASLSFLTGTNSMEELEQLITVDFAPIIQAQIAAGQAGQGGPAVSVGQVFPGGYTVVCVYPDGGIAVAPPVVPEPTPLPLPTADTDVPEDEEDPGAAASC